MNKSIYGFIPARNLASRLGHNYGETKGEVVKKLREIAQSVEDGAYVEPPKLTIGQWIEIWLNEHCGNLKGYTIRNHRSQVKTHILPSLNSVKLARLSPHMIQTMYNMLERKKGLAGKTVHNIHGILHKALAQAVKIGYLKNNPADGCTVPRVIIEEFEAAGG